MTDDNRQKFMGIEEMDIGMQTHMESGSTYFVIFGVSFHLCLICSSAVNVKRHGKQAGKKYFLNVAVMRTNER